MRHWKLWAASLVTGAMLLVSWADAEPADKQQGAGGCSKEAQFIRLPGDQGGCSKETLFTRLFGGQDGCNKETQVNRTDGGRGFVAQPPGKKGKKGGDGFGKGGPKGARGGRGITEEAIVDRLLSFDKNNDGKLTKDELPERMQDLIARGDTNKDGALDKEEIRKLAVTLAREGLPAAFGDRFAGGPGGFGPGGFGGKGKGGFQGGFKGGFGPKGGFGAGSLERTLTDLNLSDKTKEKAEAIVKAHEENVRRLLELARTDLLVKMKDVLSEQEYKTFKAAAERQSRVPPVFTGTTTGPSAEQNRRIERLLKEVEDLRRELKR